MIACDANPVSVASQENQHLRTSLQLHAMSSVPNNDYIFIDVSGSKPHGRVVLNRGWALFKRNNFILTGRARKSSIKEENPQYISIL